VIGAHLVACQVPGADHHDDLQVVLELFEHRDLGVRREAREHAGGVEVVEELAAELEVELAAELAPPGVDVVGLEGEVLLPVEPDRVHAAPPDARSYRARG